MLTEGEANTLAQKVLYAHSDYVMWKDMGHRGTINAREGLKKLYKRIYAEAMLERMTGKWDGGSPYFSKDSGEWDIDRVAEIIKENRW